jgi:hypothetical protein
VLLVTERRWFDLGEPADDRQGRDVGLGREGGMWSSATPCAKPERWAWDS